MRFREWLLSEMAYFRTLGPVFSYEDKLVHAVDMRFEDNPETSHLNQRSSFVINLEETSIENENISVMYPWLVCDGYFVAKGVTADEIDLEQYEKIPSDWVEYAEFYDEEYEVIKPAKKHAYERLT